MDDSLKLLIIEPFYGGSHKRLVDVLLQGFPSQEYLLLTMSPKKWHWRARTSALYISQQIPNVHNFKILFCSSVLPLAELLGLRPDLTTLKKIVYFHENQLVYPIQKVKERDYQYGHNDITTCISADIILFNSNYNKTSFMSNVDKYVKIQPDYWLHNIKDMISSKMAVIYFPLDLEMISQYINKQHDECKQQKEVLHIIWPHRWEHDKDPKAFLNIISRLADDGIDFQVSILGQDFKERPDEFERIHTKLNDRLKHFGFIQNVGAYYKVLSSGDIVVSTALHEFFGLAVLEAVHCGCFPLLPNRLSYPEIFPKECLYETEENLYETLMKWCQDKTKFYSLKNKINISVNDYSSENWINKCKNIMGC